mmetsp:Transcript_21494/g.59509  ORF Transcript_21494/g.59509 Transcript_21494/m.59509 type:complete len:451 (+) Transcript_21494:211-1563(+)|eukprot:CAMPEP_0202351396 /NCGR_PEP_ID=MMETSP1126-20121109/8056_1 /ASSEMBLY_ACC=CAM_ASM_000457 /TAXON_ID=3047 /ORGANISM="Dunaliella tertiolecta, Strain CCMP1320" /LENGTH=450 /DNA_ID=CAMNT_0048943501 /DNA_START=137 /DNA_END=1489 /DNA_ORIENTATION=+
MAVEQTSPPPEYESVLQDTAGFFTPAAPVASPSQPYHAPEQGAVHNDDPGSIHVQVLDPVKQGEGVSAYVTFKIRTTTSHPAYTQPVSEVVRRFSHFSWLHQKLTEKNKGCIVPALPEKSAVQKFQMSLDFIEQRRRALQVFLTKVASHPVLKDSKELQLFLESNDQDWTLEMARWQAESSAGKAPAVNGALQWFKSLHHSAQNMVSGRSDDNLEDADYIKVRDYINNLEAHLVEAHRQAARLIKKETELNGALEEFGHAAEQLGKFDDGPMRGSFDVLCGRSGQIATSSRQRAHTLACNFEAPLKEMARTIKCVQTTMADRAAALSQLTQAKSDLDGRKVKLAKLRGTPGLKEEKITEAEREVEDGEARVRAAKLSYDSIVARMTEEMNRFQKERASDMSALLRDFALAQAQAAAENARAWSAMLADIQQQQAAGGVNGGGPGTVPSAV